MACFNLFAVLAILSAPHGQNGSPKGPFRLWWKLWQNTKPWHDEKLLPWHDNRIEQAKDAEHGCPRFHSWGGCCACSMHIYYNSFALAIRHIKLQPSATVCSSKLFWTELHWGLVTCSWPSDLEHRRNCWCLRWHMHAAQGTLGRKRKEKGMQYYGTKKSGIGKDSTNHLWREVLASL